MISRSNHPGSRLITVWAVLVVLTLISFWMHDHGASPEMATTIILALSFIKVFLVGYSFMEIGGAPAVLRSIFMVWCGGTCLLLIALALIL